MSTGEIVAVVLGVVNIAATIAGFVRLLVVLEHRLTVLETRDQQREERTRFLEGLLADARILMLGKYDGPAVRPAPAPAPAP